MLQLGVDALAIGMLIHSSGGVSSGLATLLVLPTGATATIVGRRYALLGTAMRAPVGPIRWAGTETATHWPSFIDGAIRSGEREAAAIRKA